ncbi:MAG: helix-turn-helix domain-containing protein [Alphaproteobacteria bacterium]|jgi:predicted XRE-type DNA-binding protein|nr:helix-turn-helix domain-containing protein [Alphaproteobacteria bacterium]
MTEKIIKASDNIFADLKIKEPEEVLAKAELARKIQKTIISRKLTQTQAARVLGLKQPDVSDLFRGRLHKFSIDRLIHLLNLLDWDVDIVIKRNHSKFRPAVTHVVAA